jgi:ABC-type antimicrobial peptide transport system permease subunit
MQTAQFLVVRAARPAGEMGTAIRRAIAGLDANQTVFLSASMRDLIGDSVADRRFITLLLAITGCLALLLAAAGVYGVIAYTTSRRTQEIGIRMAVGATPGNVLALIFRQGFAAVAMGLGLGLGAAMAALRLLRTVLPGLEAGQSAYIGVAVWLVMAMAALACWLPARRATRTDPLEALRQE